MGMRSNRLRSTLLPVLLTAAVLLMVGLRLVALSSDPYVRLDWCTGLLTDEGYYSHNARNQVLFGHPTTDEFNNRLLSPLLHLVQVGVFSRLGSGIVPARLVSVVGSLLTLLLFYAALRRAFGLPVARLGTLFLGLDHVNLLFNRLALMDTPAALLAVAAFYAYVRAGEDTGEDTGEASERRGKRDVRRVWLFVCGGLLGLTVVTRSLCVYLLPVPFLAGGRGRSEGTGEEARRPLGGLAAGLALVLVVYAVVWGLPHRAELGAMNAYYRQVQIQPKTLLQLGRNVFSIALLGDVYGYSSYLFRHTPIAWLLACFGLGTLWMRPDALTNPENRRIVRFLCFWLASALLLLAISNYAPNRYYVSFYPALFGLAAVTLIRFSACWQAWTAPNRASRCLRGLLAGWLTYHLLEWLLVSRTVGRIGDGLLQIVVPLLTGGWMARKTHWHMPGMNDRFLLGAAGAWLAVNLFWLIGWGTNLSFRQQELNQWLTANLPPNSVLLGDVAPGVSTETHFTAVNVIPKLCNWINPVERYAGRPRYIVILDDFDREAYWRDTYPNVVTAQHLVRRDCILGWDIAVYRVDMPDSNARQENAARTPPLTVSAPGG